MFDKRMELFPSRGNFNFLSHCSISPFYVGAAAAAANFQQAMVERGITALDDFVDLLPRYRKGFASILKTGPENISYVHTTAEAMCQFANGYPFEPGDNIVSYVHEYPSNHYPWMMQQRRDVELRLLPDSLQAPEFPADGRPLGWTMDDLEKLCDTKTRVVAVSHVQFTSGFAADLAELGAFCRDRNIDLIVDCAQSLGCLPVYPEEYGIAAIGASGWKWLMGPKGGSVLYTSPAFRDKITPTLAGPGMMRQTFDYLDHSWDPFDDGRKFEYSTIPLDHVAAFAAIAEDLFMPYSIEAVRDEVFRLQDLVLDRLDAEFFDVLRFDNRNRSGIISILPKPGAAKMTEMLGSEGVVVTERGGYLRLAPHFYLEDRQLIDAAELFNLIARS